MPQSKYRSLLSLFFIYLLSFLTAACSSSSSNSHLSPNNGTHQTGTTISSASFLKTPSTSCPAAGTAHNAIMPSLKHGNSPNIVYFVNEGTSIAPLFGKFERYDVTMGRITEIVKLPSTFISTAEISADGEWILFNAYVTGRAQLQMVRIDGQYLQTLYCAQTTDSNISNGISSVQWSPNQQLLAFEEGGQGKSTIYLLNMSSGVLYPELQTLNPDSSYPPAAWLDNTRLYLMNFPSQASPDSLYILDTRLGANQSPNSLQQVLKVAEQPGDSAQSCWNFDLSYDHTKLFTTQCGSSKRNSSHITVQPSTGGSQSTIFTSPGVHVDSIRAVSNTTLLLIIQDIFDTSHNGLWKMNTDGTGLTRLTTDGTNEASFFTVGSHSLWSTISGDGSIYAIQTNYTNEPFTFTLKYGLLQGGGAKTFVSSHTQTFLVGWITT